MMDFSGGSGGGVGEDSGGNGSRALLFLSARHANPHVPFHKPMGHSASHWVVGRGSVLPSMKIEKVTRGGTEVQIACP
jgi:hypothetical protein